jgi:hypothetical protein
MKKTHVNSCPSLAQFVQMSSFSDAVLIAMSLFEAMYWQCLQLQNLLVSAALRASTDSLQVLLFWKHLIISILRNTVAWDLFASVYDIVAYRPVAG